MNQKIETPTPASIDERVIKLSKPITTHNGEVHELRLKDPGGEVTLRLGLPWRQIVMQPEDGGQKFEIEYIPEKMARYLEAMSGIDKLSLGGMQARDVNACFTVIMQMLQPASF